MTSNFVHRLAALFILILFSQISLATDHTNDNSRESALVTLINEVRKDSGDSSIRGPKVYKATKELLNRKQIGFHEEKYEGFPTIVIIPDVNGTGLSVLAYELEKRKLKLAYSPEYLFKYGIKGRYNHDTLLIHHDEVIDNEVSYTSLHEVVHAFHDRIEMSGEKSVVYVRVRDSKGKGNVLKNPFEETLYTNEVGVGELYAYAYEAGQRAIDLKKAIIPTSSIETERLKEFDDLLQTLIYLSLLQQLNPHFQKAKSNLSHLSKASTLPWTNQEKDRVAVGRKGRFEVELSKGSKTFDFLGVSGNGIVISASHSNSNLGLSGLTSAGKSLNGDSDSMRLQIKQLDADVDIISRELRQLDFFFDDVHKVLGFELVKRIEALKPKEFWKQMAEEFTANDSEKILEVLKVVEKASSLVPKEIKEAVDSTMASLRAKSH